MTIHSETTRQEDWNHCYSLWSDHMRIEAASCGYDFEAGKAASREYYQASSEYRDKHGVRFDPWDELEGAPASGDAPMPLDQAEAAIASFTGQPSGATVESAIRAANTEFARVAFRDASGGVQYVHGGEDAESTSR